MSADSLEPEGIPGSWGGLRIKTAVGNAAVNGEDFSWHLDMDPSSVDPTSPWAERFGLYVNREQNKHALRLCFGVFEPKCLASFV